MNDFPPEPGNLSGGDHDAHWMTGEEIASRGVLPAVRPVPAAPLAPSVEVGSRRKRDQLKVGDLLTRKSTEWVKAQPGDTIQGVVVGTVEDEQGRVLSTQIQGTTKVRTARGLEALRVDTPAGRVEVGTGLMLNPDQREALAELGVQDEGDHLP